MKTLSCKLQKLFYFIFSIVIFLILLLCIPDTQNNLPPSRMVVLPLLWCLCITAAALSATRLETSLSNHRCLYIILAGLYGLFLLILSLSSRAIPDNDHAQVFQGALYFAGLSGDISWEYFARCYNNVFPTLVLSLFIRIGALLGIQTPYYFPVFMNVIQIMLVLYSLYKLSMRRKAFPCTFALLGFLLLFLVLPVAGHTQATYTDAMSIGFGIFGYYLFLSAEDKPGSLPQLLKYILSGICWGIGICVKATVAISLIALFLSLLITWDKKRLLKSAGVLAIACIIFFSANFYTKTLPCNDLRDSYGTPELSYWLGIGLKGNGGYVDNQDYSSTLNTIEGLENKENWSKKYILDNAYEFFHAEHLISKAKYNFANGDFGASNFMRETTRDNFIYQSLSTSGNYFWRYSMLNTSYFYFLLLMAAFGSLRLFFSTQNNSPEKIVPFLTVFGLVLYLMLFEANNRQLYNHIPWFILTAQTGISALLSIRRK